jgi:hypothetical protein
MAIGAREAAQRSKPPLDVQLERHIEITDRCFIIAQQAKYFSSAKVATLVIRI